MINIFSDSACRIFGNTKGINSYFVGTGLTHNLLSKEGCDLILNSINKVNFADDDNYLFFGEYDIRISMGFGNLPHNTKKLRFKTNKRLLNLTIENYSYLIDSLPTDFKIITPTSSFMPELNSLEYFSQKLITKYPTKVIDLTSLIYNYDFKSKSIKILPNYKSELYEQNPYISNSENTTKLLCNILDIEYNFEEKGNMPLGSFYIQ